MNKYKELLTVKGQRFYEDLVSGELTEKAFNNKKGYSRSTKNIVLLLDLVCAWECYKNDRQ